MSLNLNKHLLENIVVFGLLFLAAMNFRASFFYIVLILFILLMAFQKKFLLQQFSLIYFVLGILMAAYNHSEGIFSMMQSMNYVIMYLIGYNIQFVFGSDNLHKYNSENKFNEEKEKRVILSICAGTFTHYILNFLNNINNFNDMLGRNTNDIWTGASMAATLQASLACLMLGLSVALILAPTKKIQRYIGFICLFVILFYDLILACRTMFVMLFILFFIGIIYVQKELDTRSKKFKFYLGIVTVLLLLAIVYCYNIAGIQDYITQSNLFNRFEPNQNSILADKDRFSNKLTFFINGYKFLFGGLNMRSQFGYAHDLLLDSFDHYGIFVLILLVCILIYGIKEFFKLIKSNEYSTEFKLTLICIYSAMLIEFCIEPILDGMSWFFGLYCLLNGSIVGMNRAHVTKGIVNENIAN